MWDPVAGNLSQDADGLGGVAAITFANVAGATR